MSEKPCTILVGTKNDPPQLQALKKQLESKDIIDKRKAMKSILLQMQQGENLNSLLMFVIRFAMPAQDHELKKLLLIYWEIFDKRNDQGKLLPEMILVV
jgi:coatomer subunit beta